MLLREDGAADDLEGELLESDRSTLRRLGAPALLLAPIASRHARLALTARSGAAMGTQQASPAAA